MKRNYQIIDVCHTVEDGMITYKGLPAPVVRDHLTRAASKQIYADGTEFQIGKIEMVANTGTYLDSPFHRYAAGTDNHCARSAIRWQHNASESGCKCPDGD